jgi:ribonucleoside-diphosphate reductase alpha chain
MTTHYQGTPNALKVLEARYLVRDEHGELAETPEGMFRRVARTIASAEDDAASQDLYYGMFYDMMINRDFLPNTPCLVNAGRVGGTGQFSACFVLPVPDSMEGIFDAVKQMALVHKTGGGTGFSFSRLRPKGDRVRTTSGVASGPVSFMTPFNATTETTKQGGVRRGANMGILRVDHPDIMEFINVKANDVNALTNFNISVGITDAFMDALRRDDVYDLVHPSSKSVVGRLRAVDVWHQIVKNAWRIGDPGLFFIDRANAADLFGTSIPTRDFPGIGASIRIG